MKSSIEFKTIKKISEKALDVLVISTLIGLGIYVTLWTIPTMSACIFSTRSIQTCSSRSFADLLEFTNSMFDILRQNSTTILFIGFASISVIFASSLILSTQRKSIEK
jgi:hypothetical protein